MQRRGVAVVDDLAAGNSDGVGLDLDIEGRLADARQLGDQHDIVTLPKDVERRVGAGGRPQSSGLSARPHGGAVLWRLSAKGRERPGATGAAARWWLARRRHRHHLRVRRGGARMIDLGSVSTPAKGPRRSTRSSPGKMEKLRRPLLRPPMSNMAKRLSPSPFRRPATIDLGRRSRCSRRGEAVFSQITTRSA